MTLQQVSLLAVTRKISIVDDVSYILSNWSKHIWLSRAETLEEVCQYASRQLDMILIDPFACHRSDPLTFFKEVRQTLRSTPMVCLLPEDSRDYRDIAVEMGANGMIVLNQLPTELLPLVQNLVLSTPFMQKVDGHIQESARHTSPAGESAQKTQVKRINLETRSDEVVARLSGQILPTADGSSQAKFLGTSLRHLKVATNSSIETGRSFTVRTACNHDCGFHYCGMNVTVRDHHISKIEPAEFNDPRYRSICQKGISYVQVIAQPDRLLHPLKRTGPRGANTWEQISWDQALLEISQKLQFNSKKYGPESNMFLTSKGQAGILNGYFGVYYRLASLLGASAVDPQKLGMDTGVPSGIEDIFGANAGFRSNAFQDLPNSKMILIWGSNPVRSWVPWWPFFLEAKKAGARLATIDPRFTATAAKSDNWLPIRPGTDLVLALGMINLIIQNGWFNAPYLLNHTVSPFLVEAESGRFLTAHSMQANNGNNDYLVWDEAAGRASPASLAEKPALNGTFKVNGIACQTVFEMLARYTAGFPLERVAKKTGLSQAQILELTQAYATTRPARIFTTFGIERWGHASTFGRLVGTLGALTGNIGVPGGGAGVSGFFELPLHIGKFAQPEGKQFQRVNPAELPEYIIEGKPYPIKAVMVAFCNWFNQAADRNFMINQVLPKLDLFVVSELFMTETAMWADYVLPVATFFEREDMVKGPGPYIQYQPQILAPPGECRSDLDIAAGIGRQLGLEQYFCDSPATYLLQELAEIDPQLGPEAFSQLQERGVLKRPLPPEALIPFTDGKFNTPTGRAEIYVERLFPHGRALPVFHPPIEADIDSEMAKIFPLVCIFVHSHYRVNSTFDKASWLRELDPEPYAYLNPQTAADRQIGDQDWVHIYNGRGFVELKARLTSSVPTEVVYLTSGWHAGRYRAGHPQSLTHRSMDYTNSLGASNVFSDILVQIRRAQGNERPAWTSTT